MKQCILTIVLATMLVPTVVICQEPELQEDPEYQMELHERQLELQQREHEMALKQRMGELQLEKGKIELEHMRSKVHKHNPFPNLLVILVVHILTAVWVYRDIHQRSHQSGLWVVIALLAGLLGTLVYAVVRLGDLLKAGKEGAEEEKA